MTDEQRHQNLLRFIREYTVKHTESQKIARDTLIKEGIYDQEGELRKEFGGPSRAHAR